MVTVIDGKKLLRLLRLSEDTVTSEQIRDTLLGLSEEDRDKLLSECTIEVKEERQTFFDLPESCEYIPTPEGERLSDTDIRRRLKYEKNYMAAANLRRQLGLDIFCGGKHSKGCKRNGKRK